MVHLTTLAPVIVEAIVEVALPDRLTLFENAVDAHALLEEQRVKLADAFLGSKNAPASQS
jgi:hypothetical protein